MTDDQGWGDLSLHGNTNLSTPNIDQLASDGVVFDRFYVCAVCSPTRAELLTGRYHSRMGVDRTSAGRERMDLDETTVAQLFKQAGYQTAAYGKWHNGMQYPYHPNARGFDDYYGFCSGHWGHYFSPMLEHNGALTKGEGYLVDDLTEHAMGFIKRNKDEPFFVYLPLNTPHSPMQVPDRWWQKFADQDLTMLPEEGDVNVLHTKAAYAMCENVDWNVGRIMNTIDELSISENTVVIYLSDNGPNGHRWNGEMRGRKGSTDEGGVRSPLIMRWPGKIAAGKVIQQISGAIDLLPTLTDMAGISQQSSKPLDGISLKDLILDGSNDWPDRKIINHWRGKTSVRTQQYRLDHEGRLYDMFEDPSQKQEIMDQPAMKNELLELQRRFDSEIVTLTPDIDERPFTAGHPDFEWTQLPARDAIATGTIERSNRYPNDSYYRNWTSEKDSIYWDLDVMSSGDFEAILYYTCASENVGCKIALSSGPAKIDVSVDKAHDPPEIGMEQDRDVRGESYVKDFIPLSMGTISLSSGQQRMTLQASEIKGSSSIDFRLLMLRKIES